MSITKTLDVFCDGPDCMNWTFGIVGSRPTAIEARRNAKKSGWGSVSVAGERSDLCPDCLKEYKEND